MRRLGVVLALVGSLCLAYLAAGTTPASASLSPLPYLDGTLVTAEQELLLNPVEYVVAPYIESGGVMAPGHALPAEWEWLLAAEAEMGGTELMPASLALGPVGLTVTATLLVGGTLVYMHWFKDDDDDNVWNDAVCKAQNVDDPSQCKMDGQKWMRQNASAAASGGPAWEWAAHHLGGTWETITYDPDDCNAYLLSPGYPCNIDAGYGRDFTREMAAAITHVSAGSVFDMAPQNDVGGYATADNIAAQLRYKPCTSSDPCSSVGTAGPMPGMHLDYLGTSAPPGTYTTTDTYTAPSPTEDFDQDHFGGTVTDAPPVVGDRLNCTLDPANWACPDPVTGGGGGPIGDDEFHPFELPQISLDETYGAYVARLRAMGWLGHVRLHNEADLELSADPATAYADAPIGAPTVITVPGTAPAQFPVPIYYTDGSPNTWTPTETEADPTPDPGGEPWPDPSPLVPEVDTPIDVWKKPPDTIFPTLPPPPPGGGGTSCGDHSAGGGLNFGPLTCLDFGCKFPFGFICYAQDVTGWFSVTADAPEFDLQVPCPEVMCSSGHLAENYDVDLNVMDGWASTWRTLLSVAMWIGAVWIIATRMLGIRSAGDPGEAIDDPWE